MFKSAFNCGCKESVDIDVGKLRALRRLRNFNVRVSHQKDSLRDRSEGSPERDIWFLGTLEQGSAKIPEFLGNRRRRRRRRRRRQDLMDIEVQ